MRINSKVLILALLLLLPTISFAKTDFLSAKSAMQGKEELSQCGRSIDEFKFFLKDAKICKKDEDCISKEGFCPIGCRFYINKNFDTIISKRMDDVAEKCSDSVCSYKCVAASIQPICKQNKCQLRSGK